MRRQARIAILAAVLLAAAAPAADAKKKPRVSTFSGSCELSGTVSFSPGLTASSQETRSVADATGPCTGTWRTGKRTWELDGTPVAYHAEASGSQSCASGEATGEGYLRFRGRRLAFALEESRIATMAELHLTGTTSGEASGSAAGEGDPAAAVQACLTSGISQAAIAGTLTTEPEISGTRPR